MHQRNLVARIENAEKVADATLGQTFSGGCICFPKHELPFFGSLRRANRGRSEVPSAWRAFQDAAVSRLRGQVASREALETLIKPPQ
jgi:hypothetical protein